MAHTKLQRMISAVIEALATSDSAGWIPYVGHTASCTTPKAGGVATSPRNPILSRPLGD